MGKLNDSSLWNRVCPECGEYIVYKTYCGWYQAKKDNSSCRPCWKNKLSTIKTGTKWSEDSKLKRSLEYSGKGNPFYGKQHSDASKSKYAESRNKSYDTSKYKTDEFKLKQSENNSGKNNFFYGKSLYNVLIEKYGIDVGNQKWSEIKLKQSINSAGENNPMYGKPSPQGSGNGWSGWYKDWYFRSLRELSYMITVIERFNIKWESAETTRLSIPYTNWEGIDRTYFADFLLNNIYLIEIKPKRLWNTPSVYIKKIAAIKWCEERGYKYKLIDANIISTDIILELYKSGTIKFLKRYDDKFKEKYLNA